MRMIVHSSLSSFGRVEGGAVAVVRALMDAVGPGGTLMMPSFNHGEVFRGGRGVYDPLTTPTSNGAIPDAFWRLPGVARSLNPTHPFACWGRDAIRYTARHHRGLEMGEHSPLGLLHADGGWQLNLGTTHETTTAKHLAETLRRVPCLGYRRLAYPVRMPDGKIRPQRSWMWRRLDCPLTESGRLIDAEMERGHYQVHGRIGECDATFMKLGDVVEAVWRVLDRGLPERTPSGCPGRRNPGHGKAPPCSRCRIRPGRRG
jgi:aminoglycoside 3-N-acetyltransferase